MSTFLLRVFPAFLALLVAAEPPAGPERPVPGDDVAAASTSSDARLLRIQERRKALERDLERLRGRERSLLGEVERLELEVRLRTEQLRETQTVLRRTNEQLDETVDRAQRLEQSIAKARPVLSARARSLYKLGEMSYLRLLLSVSRPSDMLRGYRFVTSLARRDKENFSAFRARLAELNATRDELEQRTREVLQLRANLDATRRNLEADRKRKTRLLTEIVEKKETHAAFVEELQQAESSLADLILGFREGEVSVPLPAFKGSLPWPVAGPVRVPFGRRKHPKFDTYTIQNGIEIAAPADAPVRAIHEGTVVFADLFRGYGLMVVLDHGGKHHSLYAQLAESRVHTGQHVSAGEVIGSVGGGIEGPGLYFELRFQGKPENPVEWLSPATERAAR